MHFLVVVFLVFLLHTCDAAALSVDDQGYVLYCPCMGMFIGRIDSCIHEKCP